MCYKIAEFDGVPIYYDSYGSDGIVVNPLCITGRTLAWITGFLEYIKKIRDEARIIDLINHGAKVYDNQFIHEHDRDVLRNGVLASEELKASIPPPGSIPDYGYYHNEQYTASYRGKNRQPIRRKTLQKIFKRDGGVCHYCGRNLPPFGETEGVEPAYHPNADHRLPVSRGGKATMDNLVLSCHSCNSQKRDMTEEEYLEWLAARKEQIA